MKRLEALSGQNRNWYRDLALFWQFFIFSVMAVFYIPTPADRQLGLRAAGVAVVAFLLVKEKVRFLVGVLGFIALRAAIYFVLHRRSWMVVLVFVVSATLCFFAARLAANRKACYDLPDEVTMAEVLVTLGSMCLALFLVYVLAR